jgi:hypothetical protein
MTDIKSRWMETEISVGATFQIVSYIILDGEKWVITPIDEYIEMVERLEYLEKEK